MQTRVSLFEPTNIKDPGLDEVLKAVKIPFFWDMGEVEGHIHKCEGKLI